MRVTRHVINTFIARAPKLEAEEFDWWKELPGKLTLQMAPQYWIGNPAGFDATTAHRYLAAFIGQVVEHLLQPPAAMTNIRPTLEKAEALVPALAKPAQRLPMLALYFIFNSFAPETLRSAGYPKLIETYRDDFEPPSIVSLAAHLITGQTPDWPLPVMEDLHARYFRERHHADTFGLGRFLEAAFTLRLAEQNRAADNFSRARELIGFAVEAFPNCAKLRDFESSILPDELGIIDWRNILLPAAAFATQATGEDRNLQ